MAFKGLQWDQAGHTRGIDKQPAVLAAHLHVLALDALLFKPRLIPIDPPLDGGAEGIGPCHMELFCLVSTWLSGGWSAGHLLYHHFQVLAILSYLSLLQGFTTAKLKGMQPRSIGCQICANMGPRLPECRKLCFNLRRRSPATQPLLPSGTNARLLVLRYLINAVSSS